jgi:hypothetical protein
VVALNVADVEPAGTLAAVGTLSDALLSDRTTEDPPVGAAWFNLMVQVLLAFDPKLVGAHTNEAGAVGTGVAIRSMA